jgi:hypothetical protein
VWLYILRLGVLVIISKLRFEIIQK